MIPVKIFKSTDRPYDFILEPIKGYEIVKKRIDSSSNYLVVTVFNSELDVTRHYLFDKAGDLVSWEDRHRELTMCPIEVEYYDNGYRVERQRKIDMEIGAEFFEDILYQENQRLRSRELLAFSSYKSPMKELYDRFRRKKEIDDEYAKMSNEEKLDYWLNYVIQAIAILNHS